MNYTNNPIREAVFDIRVEPLAVTQIEELNAFKELIIGEFPNQKTQHRFTGLFEFQPDKEVASKGTSDVLGHIYSSDDASRQIQVGFEGLTLNILKPYNSWEEHFTFFMKLWSHYKDLFAPSTANRIAARFINRIELPITLTSFQDYITIMPPIPSCLPQIYSTFFMQIQVPCDENGQNAVISEAIEPIQDSKIPFILDIDVSQNTNIGSTIDEITSNFNEIRTTKDKIFESCITQKTKDLFLK
ncbi:MAG: TIGR04255 family protein [Bacteroidetes bacterium]|nr:TIGR04255 family protein [Bacteroidota bacterium]